MDRDKPIRKRVSTSLPHWEQAGAEVFVTFRLGDSLPKEAIDRLVAERRALERKLESSAGLDEEEEWRKLRSLQSERIEALLDNGKGRCVLRQKEVAELLEAVLKFFDGQRYRLLAWCIMPNHAHVVFVLFPEWGIEKVLHSWKSFSAKKINALIGKSGPHWQRESFCPFDPRTG